MSEAEPVRVESPAVGVDRSERLRAFGRVGLGLAVALACVMTIAVGAAAMPPLWLWFVAYAMGAASIGAMGVAASRRRPRTSAATVEIRAGALSVVSGDVASSFGPMEVPLTDIVQGWEEPSEVRFTTRAGETLVIRTRGATEGERLLRAAGVSANKRVLRVPLASAASRAPGGKAPIGVVLGAGAVHSFIALAALAERIHAFTGAAPLLRAGVGLVAALVATVGLAFAFRRREAVVGTDGILVQNSLRRRLIRYADLESAVPDTRGVVLELQDGRRALLPTLGAEESPLRPELPGPEEPVTDAEARRGALLARIHQAMTAPGDAGEVWASLEQLDRRGRPFAAWREDLARVLAHPTDYRTVGIGASDLGGVIEDPGAPAERRIAAALALASAQPDEARKRTRIAADACADEALRRALERAAEGEIDEELLEREAARTKVVR
jgi:hypothetical protein